MTRSIFQKLRRVRDRFLVSIIVVGIFLSVFTVCAFQQIWWPEICNGASEGYTFRTLPVLPPPRYVPSAKDLAYGEQQVMKMVRDRPQMRGYVRRGDPVWQYCVRQFAGEGIGSHIAWCDETPQLGEADSESPTRYQAARIRIRHYYDSGLSSGQERAGEDLWASAVFEFNNLRSYKQFDRLAWGVIEGNVSRQQFIIGYARIEYKTTRNMIRVYNGLWRPSMEKQGIAYSPWLCTQLPDTFEQSMAAYTDRSGYPWGWYGPEYDESRAGKHR